MTTTSLIPSEKYRLPAEWERQSGILIAWPHSQSDWASSLAEIELVYIALAAAISERQNLIISCWDEIHCQAIRHKLNTHHCNVAAIRCIAAKTNDTWVRDSGPLTVLSESKRPLLLDFIFNGWGNKYDAQLDNQLTQQLAKHGAFSKTPIQHANLVLEGGSIEVDGIGTLLTTQHCLLSPSRNPNLSQSQLEAQLIQQLGIERILWLTSGYLIGDDTDSHIDMLARFCNTETMCYVSCSNPKDVHYIALQYMERELSAFRTIHGKKYDLIPLPWPQPKYDENHQRLPASYANFLIINDAVLVPTYNDPADDNALDLMRSCFPNRDIIGIPSLPLITQRGGIHCATMQLPAGVLPTFTRDE